MSRIKQSQWIYDLTEHYRDLFLWELEYQLDVGDGWRPIVQGLVERLANLNLPAFKIAQIKQKFDELRCYTQGEEGNREVAAIITQAQDLAARTCERCGNPIGHIRCHRSTPP